MGAHVAHHLQDFVVGLAQAHHDAALGGHVWMEYLELLQQVQAELVVAAGPCFLVQTRRGFQVVVHYIGRRKLQDFQSAVIAPAEVGHQDFDLRHRRQLADVADAVDEMLTAAVAEIVAVDAGDHHVLQLQPGDGFCQVEWLVPVERIRSTVAHIAERAASRALVAHDHESGRTVAEALADVGAGGFFTHCVQVAFAQDLFDLVEARGR